MPPRVPGRCFLCGKDAMLEGLFCEECAPRLAPPRREPIGQSEEDWKVVECHPSSADLMIAAGYTLYRAKIDPDTRIIISQVWVKLPADEGS